MVGEVLPKIKIYRNRTIVRSLPKWEASILGLYTISSVPIVLCYLFFIRGLKALILVYQFLNSV